MKAGWSDMFAGAVIIKVKLGCDFPRALIHHAMDPYSTVKARQSERNSALSAVLLSVRELP